MMNAYRILLRKCLGKWLLGFLIVSVGDCSGLCLSMGFGSDGIEPLNSVVRLNMRWRAVAVEGVEFLGI